MTLPNPDPDSETDIYALAVYPDDVVHNFGGDVKFFWKKHKEMFFSISEKFQYNMLIEVSSVSRAEECTDTIKSNIHHYKYLFGKEALEKILETASDI